MSDVGALAEVIHATPGVECSHVDHKVPSCERDAEVILASPWLAERVQAARAEALEEAADRWTQGAWSDVMLPKPTPPAIPVIAYSNRMGDWLRARAAALRADDAGGEGL